MACPRGTRPFKHGKRHSAQALPGLRASDASRFSSARGSGCNRPSCPRNPSGRARRNRRRRPIRLRNPITRIGRIPRPQRRVSASLAPIPRNAVPRAQLCREWTALPSVFAQRGKTGKPLPILVFGASEKRGGRPERGLSGASARGRVTVKCEPRNDAELAFLCQIGKDPGLRQVQPQRAFRIGGQPRMPRGRRQDHAQFGSSSANASGKDARACASSMTSSAS